MVEYGQREKAAVQAKRLLRKAIMQKRNQPSARKRNIRQIGLLVGSRMTKRAYEAIDLISPLSGTFTTHLYQSYAAPVPSSPLAGDEK